MTAPRCVRVIPAVIAVAFLCTVGVSLKAAGETSSVVTNISWDSKREYNRFILQFDQLPKFNAVDNLSDSKLYYVDLYGINQIYKRRLLNVDDDNLKYVDAVTFNDRGVLRFVFYVKGDASRFQVNTLENPPRIVIDTVAASAAPPDPTANAAAGNARTGQTNLTVNPNPQPGAAGVLPAMTPVQSAGLPGQGRQFGSSSSSRKVVVIDPGHGGNANGAMSKSLVNGRLVSEKEITLQFAYYLKQVIDSAPNMVALVTRTDDSSLGLYQRVSFAEMEAKADIFISLHCNDGDGNLNARGMEMYYLSEKGTTDAAIKDLEAKENKDEGAPPLASGSLLHSLITDLKRDIAKDWQHESHRFCSHLEHSLLQHPFYKQNYRKIKSANFAVLKNLAMPAMLLEIGFITNSEDLKFLVHPTFQEQTAVLIFNGINTYFAETDKSFKPTKRRI